MSADGNRILCRKCGESISLYNASCPNCGKSIRGTLPYVAGVLLGIVLIGAAALNPGSLLVYGVVGLIVAATSAHFIYEKRQRIAEAGEQAQTFEG